MGISIFFIACSAALIFLSTLFLLRQYRKLHNEEWLERPPLLFRAARPVARLFAADTSTFLQNHLPKPYAKMLKRLHGAGLGYSVKVEEWWLLRFMLLIGVGAIVWLLLPQKLTLGQFSTLLLCSLPFVAAIYPDLYIRDRIKKRYAEIEKTFPFFLELLVMAVRSGLNFSAALAESGHRLPAGPTRDEIEKVLREIRTGKSRRDALIELKDRVVLSAIASFVSSVNQAEETGSEISAILILQAEQSRTERFLNAEKKANQAPVKMLLPLVAGMFPVTFIMIGFLVFIKLRETGAIAQLMGS